MNLDSPVVKLCMEGTQAEFQRLLDKARALYQAAWDAAQNDSDACIAAHYVAHLKEDNQERLFWNQIALEKANAVTDGSVADFYPSLYLNMGQSYELLGDLARAKEYYQKASELGADHLEG
jgi:tetratricopeptide (TPR) repeat protein